MDRFQIGHGWSRTGLLRPGAKLHEALVGALRREVGRNVEIHWRRVGADVVRTSRNAATATEEMIAFARKLEHAVELEVIGTAGATGKRLKLHKYVAEPTSIGSIPSIAKATRETRATIRFNNEISLAIPEERTLGLYAPRPLRSDPSYWSEHAYAAARDAGGDNRAGTGYEPAGPRLAAILAKVTAYTLANYRRLAVRDHIHNGRRWRRSDTGPAPEPTPYTGSDRHTTHTHTAFGDHDGRKPAWL